MKKGFAEKEVREIGLLLYPLFQKVNSWQEVRKISAPQMFYNHRLGNSAIF